VVAELGTFGAELEIDKDMKVVTEESVPRVDAAENPGALTAWARLLMLTQGDMRGTAEAAEETHYWANCMG
jgi:hypothetical protein